MRAPRSHPGPPHRLRLPRRTARLRLTALYGAAFVVCGACGAALLAVTYLLYGHLTPHVATDLTTHLHGHTTHITHIVPQATRQAGMTIRVAGLGQITFDRQQLLIASAIALAVFVVAAARPAISQLGLNVHASIQPAIVDGDPLLVQQLAANLIDNAIRHNISGGDIQVATGTSSGHAVLSVANSGQVIPPAEVDRLFQPFQRLGPRPARRDGGHGLGLSIVRAIATAHGATIGARALPDGGLAIDITFPSPSGPRPRIRQK